MAKAGRPKTNFEQMPARFPEGTLGRIDAVRQPGETRVDFLRTAVTNEIEARLGGLGEHATDEAK